MDSSLTVRRGYGFLWITMVLMLAFIGDAESAGLLPEKTPGEKFREAIKIMEQNCAARKNVPAADASCDLLNLKPYDALSTPEGRFAHSIKLPPPYDNPKNVYRTGVTSEEYFRALCDTEAGDFVFKTVSNVDGLFQMRAGERVTDLMLTHLYALEDPYGYASGETVNPEEYFVQPSIGVYQFLELMPFPEQRESNNFIRLYRDPRAYPGKSYQTAVNGVFTRVPYIVAKKTVNELSSKYGYTWRGISRPHDRELGIAGSELIILDLKTKEPLAFRRGFIRAGSVRNSITGVWWLQGHTCPKVSEIPRHVFIKSVLKPAPSIRSEGVK